MTNLVLLADLEISFGINALDLIHLRLEILAWYRPRLPAEAGTPSFPASSIIFTVLRFCFSRFAGSGSMWLPSHPSDDTIIPTSQSCP